jgi:NhaP-type Na+/H+ or K+/H+ antiporter
MLFMDPTIQRTLKYHNLWGSVVSIYFIILFARLAAIAIMYPLLKRLGTGCTWKEAFIMWWGGLRGSVGLALALIMYHTIYDDAQWQAGGNVAQYTSEGMQQAYDDGLLPGRLTGPPRMTINAPHCQLQPTMLLMMTVIVVFCTVLINGVTMAPISMRIP